MNPDGSAEAPADTAGDAVRPATPNGAGNRVDDLDHNRAGRRFEPSDEQSLIDAIRDARAERMPLTIEGGGTRAGLGHPVGDAATLSLGGLSGITSYEPGALTLIARAGTTLAEIDAALADCNQRLPFEPIDHRRLYGTSGEPTVGGMVATNASGPRRVRAGACRDSLLGVRFVDGTGTLVKSGGRVMKNVTGYDLVKLLCGSHGTLGAITEVVCKVLPMPEREVTLAVPARSLDAAVSLMSRALGTPYEIDGAAFDERDDGRVLLRVSGFDDQVDYRLDRLRVVAGDETELIEGDAHRRCWRDIRDVTMFADDTRDVWRFSVRSTQAPALVARLRERFDASVLLDWGGGLVWAAWHAEPETDDPRPALEDFDAHGTPVRVASSTGRSARPGFDLAPPRLRQIADALRGAFDPDGILNPGRMG